MFISPINYASTETLNGVCGDFQMHTLGVKQCVEANRADFAPANMQLQY